jgi:DNA-binding HxlR family transcriptional regulator
MKVNPFEEFDKLLEHRIRLQIVSVLMANESFDYNGLKELLQATDGNLATHLKQLESAEYIRVEKQFVGRKPQTNYFITKIGQQAFVKHLNAMEALLKQQKMP